MPLIKKSLKNSVRMGDVCELNLSRGTLGNFYLTSFVHSLGCHNRQHEMRLERGQEPHLLKERGIFLIRAAQAEPGDNDIPFLL